MGTIQWSLCELQVAFVDATPMEVVQERVNVLYATRTILVIVCVLKHIARHKWNAAPHSTVVVLIDEYIQQSSRVQRVETQHTPT